MSTVAGRRRRNYAARENPVLLQARVEPAIRAKANAAADAAGICMADYLEQLIARDTVDSNGCPLWLPARTADQEELPLKTA